MARRPLSLLVGWAFVIAYSLTAAAQNVAPTPDVLLAKYEGFLRSLSAIHYDSLDMLDEKGGPFSDWTWTGVTKCSYARAGERWRVRTHEVGFNYYDKRQTPFDLEGECAFDGNIFMIVNRDYRDARTLPSMGLEEAHKRLAGSGSGSVETSVVAEIGAEKPAGAREYSIQNPTFVLYGYIPNDRLYILDLLRETTSRLSVGSELVEGRRCDVLKAVTTHGVVTLWLDPAAGYAPLRLNLHKAGNDLLNKTAMRPTKGFGRREGGCSKPADARV